MIIVRTNFMIEVKNSEIITNSYGKVCYTRPIRSGGSG